MRQFISAIKSNFSISKDFYKIDFTWSGDEDPIPGQFFTVRLSETTAPLLRRPFAFAGFNSSLQEASMIYQVRGPATKLLSQQKEDSELDIIGPMGNYFDIGKTVKRSIIVSGGIGLGPMLFAAKHFQNKGNEVNFIFGCRTKKHIPAKDMFDDVTSILCTDDGSEGFKGTTVDYLQTILKNDLKDSLVLACGPIPMLKGCHNFAERNRILCQVSMEQIMACGVGACMGCAVKIKKDPGYSLICNGGPVFNSREIVWT